MKGKVWKDETVRKVVNAHSKRGGTYSKRERAPSLGVNEEQSGDSEDDLHGTVTEGCVQRLSFIVADIGENGGAVERDNVDTAELKEISNTDTRFVHHKDQTYLLSQHDSRSAIVRPPDPRHSKAVPQAPKVPCPGRLLELLLVNDPRVVVVPRSNDGVRAQLAHRLVALGQLAMLHEPTGGLGAEVDTDGEDEGGDEGRAELEAPGDFSRVLDDDVRGETEEDA